MNTRWHDLTFDRLKDGGIHLEQQAGCEEPSVIHLHPEQVLFIARQLCGMKPETAEKVADLERKLAILCDRLGEFISDPDIRTDIIKRCGDGIEYIVRLDGIHDLAIEFDGNRLLPNDPPEPKVISDKFKPMAPPKNGQQLGLAV
jgi:hypothetical protein